MDSLLAQIATTEWSMFFACFAGFVGLIGVASALIAHASTIRDRALIKSSAIGLTSDESWDGAHSFNDHDLTIWLRKRGIAVDSGVADIFRACWSGWIGSRATTLTELHVLVSRRERSKLPARLSGGIAALLLIIGIVGTLSSVKPVLKAFQFRISNAEGEMPITDAPAISNVAESTELVNSLMHNLGDAFLPSLVALIATLFVVAFRGMYSLSLNRYTLELDRFAMGTVMPRYRPRSIADEYAEVRSTFHFLAKTIGEREEKFDKVVSQLGKLVESIEPALSGLEKGIAKIATAGDTLASKSNSIATTLTRMLGKKSPLYGAVYGFEEIFEKTNDKIGQISDRIKVITEDHERGRAQMIKTLEEISGTIENVQGDHKQDRDIVGKTIESFKTLISELPEKTITQVRGSFDSGIQTMQKRLEASLEDQKKETASTHQVIRDNTRATLDIINETLTETAGQIIESSKAIPATLEHLESSFACASEKLTKATDAIPSVIERIDSTLSGARERMDETAKAIPHALERVDEIVVKKSEVEAAAVRCIRSVADEAMSQIRGRNHGNDRVATTAARRPSTQDSPFPRTSFSDDKDNPEGFSPKSPAALSQERDLPSKSELIGSLPTPKKSPSVDSVSTSFEDSGTLLTGAQGSRNEDNSGAAESESPAEQEDGGSRSGDSEPVASQEEDTGNRGFFSKMFRRS